MRFLIALLLAAFVAQGPALAARPADAAGQDVVLKKKKRLAEAEKAKKLKAAQAAKAKRLKEAEEAKRLKAKKVKEADAAKKLKEADAEKKLKARKSALSRAKQERLAAKEKEAKLKEKEKRKAASAGCTGFFRCVFGDGQRSSARRVSFSRDSGLSNASTRDIVDWDETKYKPGSIIVRTPERALYFVMPNGQAMRYKVGVGREGFQWSGNSRISNKAEWPDWRPPQEMIEREAAKGHILPELMEGGPGNPLGARAMYIGSSIYRIHGTNNAASIGGAVSSGCIRMMNADVIDLYERVRIGARVYVYQ